MELLLSNGIAVFQPLHEFGVVVVVGLWHLGHDLVDVAILTVYLLMAELLIARGDGLVTFDAMLHISSPQNDGSAFQDFVAVALKNV